MNALEQLIASSQARPLPDLTPRLLHMPQAEGMASVVIGMRRSGKTCYLFQEIGRLTRQGVGRDRILYLNFEDDRLQPLGSDVLTETLETFYRMNPHARTQGAYLFLDEIQAVDGWARFARRVLDTENVGLHVSGSSAKMLSTEVATEFRGRGFAVELTPFSYAEFLLHHHFEVPTSTPSDPVRSQLEAAFITYLRTGGFPDVQRLAEDERIQALQDYVELVLLRDIIDRHGMRNSHAVRSFALALLQSAGSPTSVNRIANNLKSRGVAVGKDTLYDLFDHLTDAFLIAPVDVFSRSRRVKESNPRKVYAVDPGLSWAVAPAGASDLGARLECAVYHELRRRFALRRPGAISYYTTTAGHEVDFIVGDPEIGTEIRAIQVCADMSRATTRDREVRALQEAMHELHLEQGEIVSLSGSETIETDAGIIRVIPAWAWMLGL